MNETITTVTGNVVDNPTRRRLESGISVTSFRVASTTRRYDKAADRWIDGDSLFLRVTCWRALAENVERSMVKGDPVLLTGKLSTRLFDVEGGRRASFELEATSVGFDLARGTAQFHRTERAGGPTTGEVGDDGMPIGPPVDEHLDALAGRERVLELVDVVGSEPAAQADPDSLADPTPVDPTPADSDPDGSGPRADAGGTPVLDAVRAAAGADPEPARSSRRHRPAAPAAAAV